MSLRRNIAANYASQIYVTVIGIVMVPVYISYMGVEAYGLVGFYVMLFSWFQLLDMGLTPTMARATARYAGGGSDAAGLRRLMRVLEGIFLGAGGAGALLVIAGAGAIATTWLKVEQLPQQQVQQAIQLMGLIIALRWMSGLYRGALTGFEKQTWLAVQNCLVATARFVLVVPMFILWGSTPLHFFAFQALVALLELLTLAAKTYRSLPPLPQAERVGWLPQWSALGPVWRFSLALAFSTAVWVMVRQTDKLILSKFLPLAEYAYYTLAVVAASGLTVVSGPVGSALVPRMTRLHEQGDEERLRSVYFLATQVVAVATIAATATLCLFPLEVLVAWTGNIEAARKAAPILQLYALGNGLLALGAFPYYLQMAKGDVKLHAYGNLLFLLLVVPAIVWGATVRGGVGAGFAWFAANGLYLLIWTPVVHRRFGQGLHAGWALRALAPVAMLGLLAAGAAFLLLRELQVHGRLQEIARIASFFGATSLISSLGSQPVRAGLARRLRRST